MPAQPCSGNFVSPPVARLGSQTSDDYHSELEQRLFAEIASRYGTGRRIRQILSHTIENERRSLGEPAAALLVALLLLNFQIARAIDDLNPLTDAAP